MEISANEDPSAGTSRSGLDQDIDLSGALRGLSARSAWLEERAVKLGLPSMNGERRTSLLF